jgi:hypothetical protein
MTRDLARLLRATIQGEGLPYIRRSDTISLGRQYAKCIGFDCLGEHLALPSSILRQCGLDGRLWLFRSLEICGRRRT